MWGTLECQRSHLVVDGWEQAIRGAHILWPSARESRYLLRSDTDARAEHKPLLQSFGHVTKWWTPHFAKTWAHRWQLLAQVHLWVIILLNSVFVSLCELLVVCPFFHPLCKCTIIPFLLPAWNSQRFDFGEILRKLVSRFLPPSPRLTPSEGSSDSAAEITLCLTRCLKMLKVWTECHTTLNS